MDQNPGAIALVGSGEYSVQMQELETQLLHRAISRGKKNTFIQIPTASSHEGDASRAKWKRLGQEQSDRIGSECIYLPIHEREDAFNKEFVENIRDAGLIYFSGGDPHRVAEIYRDSPLWDAIVAEWNEKTRGETAFDAVMAVQGYEQHRSVIRNNSRDVASIRRLLRDDFPLTAKAVSAFA